MTLETGGHPGGIVTFLFTDVEGSTRLWAADTEATARSFVIHDKLIREAIESNDGYVFGTAGDSFRGAFADAGSAVVAAKFAQESLRSADWDGGPPLRVRMGLHRGRATYRDGDYFGPVPNTASRIEAVASGGQILMSEAVSNEINFSTLFLGRHRLRDVTEPLPIHQLGHESHRPLRTVDPELSSLPNSGTQILGREEEISTVRGHLETSSLVTLTGTGGCGKTRLALEVAHRELPNRRDGCYFADLSAVSDESELPAALATAVRLQLAGGDPLRQVIDHLAQREALVLLDNCEHLLDACAVFAEDLLARSGSTMLLTTSRQRLDVAGEEVVIVSSLPNTTAQPAAVELFVARARAVDPSFSDDPETRAVVTEICDRLDGMPLPIELAAARIAVMSPSDLLERMGDRFRLLSGGRGRHRRRTLQATLDWSYDLLDQDEQQFFATMGVFVGSFDLPAAVAVSRVDEYEALDLIDSLVSKSLITPVGGSEAEHSRFRLLETVRIYAGDQLSRFDGISAARAAHLAHYQSLTTFETWHEAEDLNRSLQLAPEWPNIVSALEWAASTEQWLVAARIAQGCQGLWETRIPVTEGFRWLALILAELDPSSEEAAWLQRNQAILAMQIDDFEEVHRLNEAVITSNYALPRVLALSFHGFTRARQHAIEAQTLLDEAQALIDTHGFGPAEQAGVDWASGTLALYSHDVPRALEKFGQAKETAEQVDSLFNYTVVASLSLATTQLIAGEPQAALGAIDRMDFSASVWDSSAVIQAVGLIDAGQPGQAADRIVDYGRSALRGRLNRQSNDALVGLAALAVHRGEAEHGWSLLQQAVAPRTPFTIGLAEALASRIGHGPELIHEHRERVTPLSELDAGAALRVELDRLAAD